MDPKVRKIANNMLEFLIDPTIFPVCQRLYFRPEEILRNEAYEGTKADVQKAYGDQRHNSDFYPIRNRTKSKKEGSLMDRRTLIASLDILSNNFLEDDPISKDLRTMSYAISKMSDDELQERVAKSNPFFDVMERVRSDPKNKGKSVKEIANMASKIYQKEKNEKAASEELEFDYGDSWTKEASDAVAKALVADVLPEKEAGKVRGTPDGTGPYGRGMGPGKGRADGTGLKKDENDDEKTAGKIKGPGKPDGTGPMSDTPACPFNKEKSDKEAGQNDPNYFSKKPTAPNDEKVSEEEAPKEDPKEAPKEEAPKDAPKEEAPKDAPKEEEIVNTSMLASEDQDFEPVQEMLASEDIGELTAEEKAQLDSLFI